MCFCFILCFNTKQRLVESPVGSSAGERLVPFHPPALFTVPSSEGQSALQGSRQTSVNGAQSLGGDAVL